MAVLYVVGTPIGNLEDITLRALRILKQADCIACEDTRRSLKLLNHYGINNQLLSYHSYNEEKAGQKIIQLLKQGKSVALLSDSGTPCISDPGTAIVHTARESGIQVVPIPGVSALTALLSAAGMPVKGVSFEGFLSPKAGRRRTQLKEILQRKTGSVLFESPFRIVKLLNDVAELDKKRRLVVARELTKVHEQIIYDTAENHLTKFGQMTKIQGEFVIYISGKERTQVTGLR
jgi:16S rRNA (cytidine1402-2'-O)-methyltransferase